MSVTLTMHHVVVGGFDTPTAKVATLGKVKSLGSKKNIYSRCITHAPSGATMREVGVVYSAHILL